jgi:hypothetical protein
MEAIEPTIKSFLTETGLIDTPAAQTVLTLFDNALTAIENWQSGTPAQEAIEAIGIFQTALSALPIPTLYITLLNIILAGVETVIGVLSANSPAPAAPADSTASAEDAQVGHQLQVAAETTAKVQALVPGFKRSIWHSAASQYNNAWDNALQAGGFPPSMAV